MRLSNYTACDWRDLSPSPSRVITSDAKVKDLMDCQRTSRNFLTFFATSYANFVRVIGWRLTVWSVVKILNACKTERKANVNSALPLIARVGIRQPETEG